MSKSYRRARREDMPDFGEQLGALIKAVEALAAGLQVPTDAQAVFDQVRAVKAAYPKPNQSEA